MKKKRLSVRIDGVWYRVAHGRLHKVRRPGSGRAGASSPSPQAAKAYRTDPCSQVSDEILDQTRTASGREGLQTGNPEISAGVDGPCSFIHGRPQTESSRKLEDSSPKEYESEESCMSTATSARKPLIIRIRLSKPTGQ